MRTGNVVTYRDGEGGAFPATVTAVVGSGESGYKLLDLEYFLDSVRFAPQTVSHVGDAVLGGGYWYLGEYVVEPPASAYEDASTGDEEPASVSEAFTVIPPTVNDVKIIFPLSE